MDTIRIEKLVHGGQGIGTLSSGQKALIWNTLPGETVEYQLFKRRRDYIEGVATKILNPHPERIEPKEPGIFLATSPWQIISLHAEQDFKRKIVLETFRREGVTLADCKMISDGLEYRYRNKIEYSFYGDDAGLHLALFRRGTHQKQIVSGSILAMQILDDAAQAVCQQLQILGVQARQLKSLIVRCDKTGHCIAALFCKDPSIAHITQLPTGIQGLLAVYSTPKSPASVVTSKLYTLGTPHLTDTLLTRNLLYDATSFFQVNVPVFCKALERMQQFVIDAPLVDMYSGVGSIGLSLHSDPLLIELEAHNVALARLNSKDDQQVVHAGTEQALEYITKNAQIIFDPPRSGLHKKVIERILEVKPQRVLYLSCNPSTQARDCSLLHPAYKITYFEGYNFFPHTPHIETLAILDRSR